MNPTHRIHGWQNSQLNIAKRYGKIRVNGWLYVIAHDEPGQPLVRFDVLRRDKLAKKFEMATEKSNERT